MQYYLILLMALSVASCREKTKRVSYSPNDSIESGQTRAPEKTKEETTKEKKESTIRKPKIPRTSGSTPTERKKSPKKVLPKIVTPKKTPPKKVEPKKEPTPEPIIAKPITPKKEIAETPGKTKKHIEKKGETAAIYCMTRLQTNPLQEMNDSPFLNVLYLKVHTFSELGAGNTSVIEMAKLKRSNYATIRRNQIKSLGQTIVTKLPQGQGLSIKYIPTKENFIEREMEFKVYQDECLEDECVSGDYKSPFFNAEAAYYLYLEESDYPTQFVDNRVSCHFSKGTLDILTPELFSNF